MLVKDYQYINSLDSGSTTYEQDVINYFKVDTSMNPDEVFKEVQRLIHYEVKELTSDHVLVNGKKYLIEKDFLDCSYLQAKRLDQLIAENDNITNLHKLLAIYVRPKKYFKIEKFDIEKQEEIANSLLEMNIEDAFACLVFFCLNATSSLRNIQISYLNQMNQTMMEVPIKTKRSIKSRLMKFLNIGTGK